MHSKSWRSTCSVCPLSTNACLCLSSCWHCTPADAHAVHRGCFESHCRRRGHELAHSDQTGRERRGDGNLRSVSPDGTCLNFLASAPCACFMRPPQPSWFCWRRRLAVFSFDFLALPRARLRGGLLLQMRVIGVDLEGSLQRGVARMALHGQLWVLGQHVRHRGGRRGNVDDEDRGLSLLSTSQSQGRPPNHPAKSGP